MSVRTLPTDGTVIPTSASSRQVAFIDTGLYDYQTLIEGVSEGIEVVLVAPDQDGIRVMAEWARTHHGFGAIHVLGHGYSGVQILGDATLSRDSLKRYQDELCRIGQALAKDGDILLYGCEVAKTAKGKSFVVALAEATGANIAASRTLTGAADFGGDWDFAVQIGAIATAVGFSGGAIRSYKGVLAAYDFESNTSGGGTTTVTQTESGIEVSISTANSASLTLFDASGVDGGSGIAVAGIASANANAGQWNVTFNSPINITQLDFGSALNIDFNWVLTPIGGSGSTLTINNQDPNNDNNNDDSLFGRIETFSGLNWTGVTGFTIANEANANDTRLVIDNITFTAAPANTAPDLGGTPADDTATEDVATAIDLSAYNVSDDDGDTITLTLAVDRGTIASVTGDGSFGGVTVTNSGTGTMTLAGAEGDLNTFLDNTSNIEFTTSADDTATATLTVTPNDGTSNGTADTVTITITPANDAPVLDAGQSPVLTAIDEDAGDDDGSGADGDDDGSNNANNTGTSVADLVVDGSITDVDGGAVEAIAVTQVDNTNGVWQYSTDNGASWSSFSGTTGSSVDITSAARLLDGSLGGASTQLVRFVPDANYTGSATFTFRAWDTSSGVAGGTADASSGGGSSAFSSATDTASVTVNAVNDAPVFTGLDDTPSYTEGAAAVPLDANATISDLELDALNGGNGDYSGASLTLVRNGGADASDLLSVVTGGNLTVAGGPNGGGTVTAGGNVIAT
ncbi:DUF4347 domain-containing protein, partial [Marinobacter xestospongiae]